MPRTVPNRSEPFRTVGTRLRVRQERLRPLRQLNVAFRSTPLPLRLFDQPECGVPLFGHRPAPVPIGVGEVHTGAQALDVIVLQIAVRDVAPRAVPRGQLVWVVNAVVGGCVRDASDPRRWVEEKMRLPELVRRERLDQRQLCVLDAWPVALHPVAPERIVQRDRADVSAEAR